MGGIEGLRQIGLGGPYAAGLFLVAFVIFFIVIVLWTKMK